MNLFLDDYRRPSDVHWVDLPLGPWAIVQSYEEFIAWVLKNGLPELISFDMDLHDEHYPWHPLTKPYFERGEIPYHLYKEKTGRDCALWLIDYCKKNKKELPQYIIHSLNTVASEITRKLLEAF